MEPEGSSEPYKQKNTVTSQAVTTDSSHIWFRLTATSNKPMASSHSNFTSVFLH